MIAKVHNDTLDIWFYIVVDAHPQQIRSSKTIVEIFSEDDLSGDWYALASCHYNNFGIFIPDKANIRVIAHELNHTLKQICQYCLIPMCHESSEIMACMAAWLETTFWREFIKHYGLTNIEDILLCRYL